MYGCDAAPEDNPLVGGGLRDDRGRFSVWQLGPLPAAVVAASFLRMKRMFRVAPDKDLVREGSEEGVAGAVLVCCCCCCCWLVFLSRWGGVLLSVDGRDFSFPCFDILYASTMHGRILASTDSMFFVLLDERVDAVYDSRSVEEEEATTDDERMKESVSRRGLGHRCVPVPRKTMVVAS